MLLPRITGLLDEGKYVLNVIGCYRKRGASNNSSSTKELHPIPNTEKPQTKKKKK